MTFQQFFSAIWRNRVAITIAAALFCAVVFGLLFAYHSEFRIAAVNLAVTIATALFCVLAVALVLSFMWKKLVGNVKGGGGGGKK